MLILILMLLNQEGGLTVKSLQCDWILQLNCGSRPARSVKIKSMSIMLSIISLRYLPTGRQIAGKAFPARPPHLYEQFIAIVRFLYVSP
ncbi:MAG: hypothetical protein C4581_01445 [Nitrospiraceae bacterium]|nr:MAG: hypothetical protein C4581_01445 [Nitrospiraceae bacterium]